MTSSTLQENSLLSHEKFHKIDLIYTQFQKTDKDWFTNINTKYFKIG